MELQFTDYPVEVITANFLLHGKFAPRGEFLTYVNDKRNVYYAFQDAEMKPIVSGYQIPGLKQHELVMNRFAIDMINVLDEGILDKLQVMQTKRPVVFYTNSFAIKGQFHVNADKRDNDLIDELRDYLAMTEAMVYPMRQSKVIPTRNVPFIALNRHSILAYHVQKEED